MAVITVIEVKQNKQQRFHSHLLWFVSSVIAIRLIRNDEILSFKLNYFAPSK